MARILVVDDENNIRLMVRIALQAAGHEVETAADGPEGLERFGDGHGWDVVLLDQRMPGMEGLQVLDEMRQRDPQARIVMITAFGTIDLAANALKKGAVNFLRKPFTTEILRGAVQAALEGAVADAPGGESQRLKGGLSGTSINGYRISSAAGAGSESDGGLSHRFDVKGPQGDSSVCVVTLPRYFMELVKAHTDCEEIPEAELFWTWLSEEALANYLWQNAELPTGDNLQVEELTTGLRRWVDAVLTR